MTKKLRITLNGNAITASLVEATRLGILFPCCRSRSRWTICSTAKSVGICREPWWTAAHGCEPMKSATSFTGRPGPDVAMFYRHDRQPVLIVLGKINAGVSALSVPGAAKVTIELVEGQQ